MYNTDYIMTGREPFSAHYEIKNHCINLGALCIEGRCAFETVNDIISKNETVPVFCGFIQTTKLIKIAKQCVVFFQKRHS